MKIKEVEKTLERFAPLPLQESYDNAGLQIGLTGSEDVSGVLLCLDVTEAVIEEAVETSCNLIVAHHPLLFRPLRRVTSETYVERCVISAIRKGIAVYAAHTNLDNAPGGVNFMMASRLGLTDLAFLSPLENGEGGSGVIGSLPSPLPLSEFLALTARAFGVEVLRHNLPEKSVIRRVALCGGAGEFLIPRAVTAGADAFLTGEIGYHRFFGYEKELLIAALGHYQSERYTIDLLEQILRKAHPELRLVQSAVKTDPIAVTTTSLYDSIKAGE